MPTLITGGDSGRSVGSNLQLDHSDRLMDSKSLALNSVLEPALSPLQSPWHAPTPLHIQIRDSHASGSDASSLRGIAENLERDSWRKNGSNPLSYGEDSGPVRSSERSNCIRVSATATTMRHFKSVVQGQWDYLFADQAMELEFLDYDVQPPRYLFISARCWKANLVNNFLWVAAMWSMFFAPLSCGFGLDSSRRHLASSALLFADMALGILYAFCSIILRFRTSIILFHEEKEIVSTVRLAQMTLQSWTFWFDVVALFPLIFQEFFDRKSDVRRWLPLMALLRTWRLIFKPLLGIKMDQFGLWTHFSRVGNLLAGTMLFAHFMACGWFLVVELCGTLDKHDIFDNDDLDFLMNAYSRALIAGAGVLYQIDAPSAYSNGERFFQALIFPVSAFVMSILFAELVLAVSQMTFASNRRHENMSIIRGATAQLGIKKNLRDKILKYQHFLTWHYDVKMYQQLTSTLSQQLHFEMKMQLFSNFIKDAKILQKLDPLQVKSLVMEFDEFVYCPGDWVVVQGEIGEEMFFIVKGSCEVIDGRMNAGEIEDENIICVKRKGDYFGEICLLFPGIRRSAHVRARSFCVIAKLGTTAFDRIISQESEEREQMLERVRSFANVPWPPGVSDSSFSAVQSPKSPARLAKGTPSMTPTLPISSAGTPLHNRARLASHDDHDPSGNASGSMRNEEESALGSAHWSMDSRTNRRIKPLSIGGPGGSHSTRSPSSNSSPHGRNGGPSAASGFCISSPTKKNAKYLLREETADNEENEFSHFSQWTAERPRSPNLRSLEKSIAKIQQDMQKLLVLLPGSEVAANGARDQRFGKHTHDDNARGGVRTGFNELMEFATMRDSNSFSLEKDDDLPPIQTLEKNSAARRDLGEALDSSPSPELLQL